MIEPLQWKKLIKPDKLGNFTISATSKYGHEYFREPTKREIVEKINELILWLNSQQK